jgi:HAD superfamily hydrolase (TIGR01450 family)
MDGAIVDLDGTVYRGDRLLSGAKAGVESLRGAGLERLFFSNNPVRDSNSYAQRLTDLGIPTEPHEACSAGVATTEYLAEHHADDTVLCIGDDGLRSQLSDRDIQLTNTPADAEVLLASWTDEFAYEDMQTALDTIGDDVPFLGTDPDRTFPGPEGRPVPGSGAIIGAVSAVVGREPDRVLGKPSGVALDIALDRLGTDPQSTLVVGDRLETDLAMGERAGMTTVLVETGIADASDVTDSDIDPDYIIDSLGDIDTVLDVESDRPSQQTPDEGAM